MSGAKLALKELPVGGEILVPRIGRIRRTHRGGFSPRAAAVRVWLSELQISSRTPAFERRLSRKTGLSWTTSVRIHLRNAPSPGAT